MAMTPLNGLPEAYYYLISSLDSIDEDENKLKFELIMTRVIQEEQRIFMRTKSAQENYEMTIFLSIHIEKSSRNGGYKRRPSYYCNFCEHTGHTEYGIWAKFPYLKPSRNNQPSSNTAFIASLYDEDPVFYLLVKYRNSNEPKNSGKWFVDTGCSNHMTFDKPMSS